MKFIIGKKMEMTQQFREDGTVVAVTKVKAGPCTVAQVKNDERDGYAAIQFGYGTRKEKNVRKPQRGHFKGLQMFEMLRELRLPANESAAPQRGQTVDVASFQPGDAVTVTGTSKGRGFQGVVKRWGFGGSQKTHGNKDQLRMPGSIGATGPAHVFKGTRMGGHMGDAQVTVKNLEVIDVDAENNILYIKGAVPGSRNGWLVITGAGEMEYKDMADEKKADNAADVKEEMAPAEQPAKEAKTEDKQAAEEATAETSAESAMKETKADSTEKTKDSEEKK